MANLKNLDPVQGLVDYVLDIKPYHTKIVEVLLEYVHTENVNITVRDDHEFDMFLQYPPGIFVDGVLQPGSFLEEGTLFKFPCNSGFGVDGFGSDTRLLITSPNTGVPFEVYPAINAGTNSFILEGNWSNDIKVDDELFINSFIEDFSDINNVFVSGAGNNQGTFTVTSVVFNDGFIDSWPNILDPTSYLVGNNPHTIVTVAEALATPVFSPLTENYVAQVHLEPIEIEATLSYSRAVKIYDAGVPSVTQTPNEGVNRTPVLGIVLSTLVGGLPVPDTGKIILGGDFGTSNVFVGDAIKVDSSIGNNGTYTITSILYNGGTDETTFGVEELIDNSTVDGFATITIPSNVFIVDGNRTNQFTQGRQFDVFGGSFERTYIILRSDFSQGKTRVRVFESIFDAGEGNAIIGTTGGFVVTGDQTARYPAGTPFSVVGSAQNDGAYTVDVGGTTFDSGTGLSTIPVSVVIDSTPGGEVHLALQGTFRRHIYGFGEHSPICGVVPETIVAVYFDEKIKFSGLGISLQDDLIAYNLENTDPGGFEFPINTVVGAVQPTVPVQGTAPLTPSHTDLWFDTNSNLFRQWNGYDWKIIKTAWWFDTSANMLYYRTYNKFVDTGWVLDSIRFPGFSDFIPAVGEVEEIASDGFIASAVSPGIAETIFTLTTPVPGQDSALLQVTVNAMPAGFTLDTTTQFTITSPPLNVGDIILAKVFDKTATETNAHVKAIDVLPHTVLHTDVTVDGPNDAYIIAGGNFIERFVSFNTFTVYDTDAASPILGSWNATNIPIIDVDDVAGTIKVNTDFTWVFTANRIFRVNPSERNYNDFQVQSSSYDGGADVTTIVVLPAPFESSNDDTDVTQQYFYNPPLVVLTADATSNAFIVPGNVTESFPANSNILITNSTTANNGTWTVVSDFPQPGDYDEVNNRTNIRVTDPVPDASNEVQIATAGQTVFTLTTLSYTVGGNNLDVYVDDVKQIVGSDYVETDSTTITFNAPLTGGEFVKFVDSDIKIQNPIFQNYTKDLGTIIGAVYEPQASGAGVYDTGQPKTIVIPSTAVDVNANAIGYTWIGPVRFEVGLRPSDTSLATVGESFLLGDELPGGAFTTLIVDTDVTANTFNIHIDDALSGDPIDLSYRFSPGTIFTVIDSVGDVDPTSLESNNARYVVESVFFDVGSSGDTIITIDTDYADIPPYGIFEVTNLANVNIATDTYVVDGNYPNILIDFNYVPHSGDIEVYKDSVLQTVGIDYLELSVNTIQWLDTYDYIVDGNYPTITIPYTYVPASGDLEVYKDGVLQTLGVDYTETNSTTVEWIGDPAVGTGDAKLRFIRTHVSTGTEILTFEINNAEITLAGNYVNLFERFATPSFRFDQPIISATPLLNTANVTAVTLIGSGSSVETVLVIDETLIDEVYTGPIGIIESIYRANIYFDETNTTLPWVHGSVVIESNTAATLTTTTFSDDLMFGWGDVLRWWITDVDEGASTIDLYGDFTAVIFPSVTDVVGTNPVTPETTYSITTGESVSLSATAAFTFSYGIGTIVVATAGTIVDLIITSAGNGDYSISGANNAPISIVGSLNIDGDYEAVRVIYDPPSNTSTVVLANPIIPADPVYGTVIGDVLEANSTSDYFDFDYETGKHDDLLIEGTSFDITGSTSNDGTYIVISTTIDIVNDIIRVFVSSVPVTESYTPGNVDATYFISGIVNVTILSADSAGNFFIIDGEEGKHNDFLLLSSTFNVVGSLSNDGLYSVSSVTYDAVPDTLQVTVANVPTDDGSGDVRYQKKLAGQIEMAGIDITPWFQYNITDIRPTASEIILYGNVTGDVQGGQEIRLLGTNFNDGIVTASGAPTFDSLTNTSSIIVTEPLNFATNDIAEISAPNILKVLGNAAAYFGGVDSPDLVVNGTFTGNADNWILGGSTVYNANAVDVDVPAVTTALTQTVVPVIGKRYLIEWEITAYTVGNIRFQYGGANGTYRNTVGVHREIITATSNFSDIIFISGGVTAQMTIDNISIKEAIGDILTISGSTGNDGPYFVQGASYDGVYSHLTLTSNMNDTTPDGIIEYRERGGWIESTRYQGMSIYLEDMLQAAVAENADAALILTSGSLIDAWDYDFFDVGGFDEELGTLIHLYSNTF